MSLEQDVKQMLVDRLRLRMKPEEIGNDMRLVGEGLGLDSIDLIELSVAVEKIFGVAIKNEQDGQEAFQSVGSLITYIEARRSSP